MLTDGETPSFPPSQSAVLDIIVLLRITLTYMSIAFTFLYVVVVNQDFDMF
jgi:hypothetical protein